MISIFFFLNFNTAILTSFVFHAMLRLQNQKSKGMVNAIFLFSILTGL